MMNKEIKKQWVEALNRGCSFNEIADLIEAQL